MNPKASTSGKVYDKMDRLCTYLLAYEPNCPAKYHQSLWLPMRHYIDEAQAAGKRWRGCGSARTPSIT